MFTGYPRLSTAFPVWIVVRFEGEILCSVSTLMRFQKCPFSSRQKRSKLFSSDTSVFVSFSPIHTKTLENDENDWDLELRMC